MSRSNRRAKLLLLAVMVLFALPILVATGLHTFAPEWRPWGTSNRGTLILPPRDVAFDRLVTLDGQNLEPLKGKWIIVVLGSSCDDRCQQLLHLIKQVRLSLGRESKRVARLHVANNAAPLPSVPALIEVNPGLRFASASPEWFQPFSLGGSEPLNAGHVYIIDPRGYLMMEYSRTEAADIQKDLKQLLKASKGG